MEGLLLPILIMVGVVATLLLAGLVFNLPRVKRWARKAESAGQATCRDCGHVGTLSYGLLTGKVVTSANIRLVCNQCQSENWFVPGGKRDSNRKGTELRRA
ncbi:MAG TPA: hypothetical protein VKW04_03935 [Planctomycetota bacterium]|nr:hypothetical protein [Planctomycetota bacterium]